MSEMTLIRPVSTAKPVRRGFPDKDIRLNFKGNFNRVVEFTSADGALQNARRGK